VVEGRLIGQRSGHGVPRAGEACHAGQVPQGVVREVGLPAFGRLAGSQQTPFGPLHGLVNLRRTSGKDAAPPYTAEPVSQSELTVQSPRGFARRAEHDLTP